jgi:transcriptional regulator with XRE-family HTH domain
MIVTPELREQLRQYLRDHGLTHQALGRQLGCSGPTVSRWLGGEVSSMRQSVSEKLIALLGLTQDQLGRPMPNPAASAAALGGDRATIRNTVALREFLMRHMLDRGLDLKVVAKLAGYDHVETLKRLLDGQLDWYPAMLSSVLTAIGAEAASAPVSDGERERLHPAWGHGWQTRDVPVLTMAHAANCQVLNGVLDLPGFWDGERLPVPTDGRAYVAFRIEGDSMLPRIHHGDTVLCDLKAEVHGGQVVVARFDDQVVCKRYRRVGDTVLLMSDNPGAGQDFELPAERLQWLLRAVRTLSEL